MSTFLTDLSSQFRLADAIDIAIVTFFIFALLQWLKNLASQSLILFVVGLASIYLLARWLELYLTTTFFQFGLIGGLLIVIVVFQQEIRHGLERLWASRWLRRSQQNNPVEAVIETLVTATFRLARERVGALLVIPGRQPLGPHIRGGVAVDAIISQPLLLSIFHPKSPGHDGAVIIDRDRIQQLGTHLPLTSNLEKLHGAGTRHAAALGLSERCDALVVVVSEERGTVRIAHDGLLGEVNEATLTHQLKQFYAHGTLHSEPSRRGRSGAAWSLAASAGIASVLWFLLAFETTSVQRTIFVPIEYRNVPEGFVIADPKPTHAQVTLSGTERAFGLLEAGVVAASLQVGPQAAEQPLRLETQGSLRNVPNELTVSEITPSSVVVRLQRSRPTEAKEE